MPIWTRPTGGNSQRYRCSIRTDLGSDQWPFNETYVENSATAHH